MTLPSGVSGKVKVYVGDAIVGSSSIEWMDITAYVRPGWKLSRIEKGDETLDLTLNNAAGKFTDSSNEDYVVASEDYPVIMMYGTDIYFRGIIDRPPMRFSSSGSDVTLGCVSRQGIFRKEDVTARYLVTEFKTVEDVWYDIVYNRTALNSYYGITYTRPLIHNRHRLLRDFIFNNKDAHSCLKELLEYHNLFLYVGVDSDGTDETVFTRLKSSNITLSVSDTITVDNGLDFERDRGSASFFNRVKVIGRSEFGDVLIAEQQDLASIQADGLKVRPTEDIGAVQSQLDVQAYAECLIAKHSKDNYTTTITLDPTKFTETELWGLKPMGVVKVTHTESGIGTDQKFAVQEVELGGDTDQITNMAIVLNHAWRSEAILRFEEAPLIYDEEAVMEDEELVESRIMTAWVNAVGWFNLKVAAADNEYPSDTYTNGGYHGLTDMGKLALKTCWLTNPKYGPAGVPADPLTMRPSKVWPLNSNGEVIGSNYWAEHADGWDNDEASGASGSDYYWHFLAEYNITPNQDFDVYGALVCSRYGGLVTGIKSDYATSSNKFELDDASYIIKGMDITFAYVFGDAYYTGTYRVTDVDYDTGIVTISSWVPTSVYTVGIYWFADCFPIARHTNTTAVTFTNGSQCRLQWWLRLVNDNDTYGTNNLSVVTRKGLESIAKRMRYDVFSETPSTAPIDAADWPEPIYLAVGLNDESVAASVADTDTALDHEVGRTTSLELQSSRSISSVSDSSKVTAIFRSIDLPPKVVRTEMSAAASSTDTLIYVDSVDGMNVGDAVYFGTSGGGGYTYSEASLSPDFIKEIRGYSSGNSGHGLVLRHGLNEDKAVDTQVTTGKLKERLAAEVKEFAVFDKPANEVTDTFFYLGKRTGSSSLKKIVETDADVSDSGMGYGDFQYDDLLDEDSLEKQSDTPPAYFSGQASGTFDYLKSIKGFGYTTVPLLSLRSGYFTTQITHNKDDFWGKANPLDYALHYLRTTSGTLGARTLSPLSDSSYAKDEHVGMKDVIAYLPSKWRLFAGGKHSEKRTWLYDNEFAVYTNEYVAQLFVFAVDSAMTRRDLKNINFLWRGTGKSHDGSNYRDGVDFFVWHHGDKQPEYREKDGKYEIIGRVGDIKTFDPHWERINMYDDSSTERNAIISGSVDYNRLVLLHSEHEVGEDNRDGINKAGYYLSDDHKIYVLAVTKHAGSVSSSRVSSIITDFAGLSISTNNIFDGEEIVFERGVDYYYDSDWDFVAWPPADFEWDSGTSTYDTSYRLREVAELAATTAVGDTSIMLTYPSIPVVGGDVLVIKSSTSLDIVRVKQDGANYDIGREYTLTGPVDTAFSLGTSVYKFMDIRSGFKVQTLKKEIAPNFPTRTFVNTGILTAMGRAAAITSNVGHGATNLSVSSSSGFLEDDMVCIYRRPDKDTESNLGYEWHTVSQNPTSATLISIDDGIDRGVIDNGSCAYDDGASDDKTVVGFIRYPVPPIDQYLSMSWMRQLGDWQNGDCLGSKWIQDNKKWGISQYPFIEGKVLDSSGNLLTTHQDPNSSVGSGYTGWGAYGGPGLKVEYYDRTNGWVWLTKARDMTLYNGHSSSETDSGAKIDDRTYYRMKLHGDQAYVGGYPGIFEISSEGNVIVARDWDCYGLRSVGYGHIQKNCKIARNGYIEWDGFDTKIGNNFYFQFGVGWSTGILFSPRQVKVKYRALEATNQSCWKDNGTTSGKKWYLDVPMFDHPDFGTGGSEYRYHDEDWGTPLFVLDIVDHDHARQTYTLGVGETISAGSTTFDVGAVGSNVVLDDLILVVDNAGNKYEIVQVQGIVGNVVTVSPAFLNSYSQNDQLHWDFNDPNNNQEQGCARVLFQCAQVYEPIDDSDEISLNSHIFRAAKYDMTYAEETGNLLVYSLLKDGTIHRPVEPDRADSVQLIQEVKFIYDEKDMV